MNETAAYLKRLAFWLPQKNRDSIVEEVRSVLLDRLEQAAATKGRPLDDEETKRELNAFGSPAVMAGRYSPHPPVISSPLALFYWKVLWISLLAVPVAQTLALAVTAMRATPYHIDWPLALSHTVSGILITFATVTVVFILLDRSIQKRDEL
jgi:hypothetical protein